MTAPIKKIDTLRTHCDNGNWKAALRLAASWPRLGDHKIAIQQGWAAMSNPNFYEEIGKDPQALIDAGVAALRAAYARPTDSWNKPAPTI